MKETRHHITRTKGSTLDGDIDEIVYLRFFCTQTNKQTVRRFI